MTPHRESPQKPRRTDCLAGDKQDPRGKHRNASRKWGYAPKHVLISPREGRTWCQSRGGGGTLQEPGLEQSQRRRGFPRHCTPGPSGYSGGFRSSRIPPVLASPLGSNETNPPCPSFAIMTCATEGLTELLCAPGR